MVLKFVGLKVIANVHPFKSWDPPNADWMKLNLDEACSNGGRDMACEGVFRDWFSQWIQGFYTYIGIRGIISTELKGALNSLIITWDLGYKKVWLEVDSLTALELIEYGCLPDHLNY